MTVFTILQNFITIRQKEPCLRRKYVDFQKMLSDPCLNIAELLQSIMNSTQHYDYPSLEVPNQHLVTTYQIHDKGFDHRSNRTTPVSYLSHSLLQRCISPCDISIFSPHREHGCQGSSDLYLIETSNEA